MAEPTYQPIASVYNQGPTSAKTLIGLGFTAAQIDKCEAAVITVSTAAVSMTMDGTTPTAANGIQLPASLTPLWVYGRELVRNLQFISASGLLNISLMARI